MAPLINRIYLKPRFKSFLIPVFSILIFDIIFFFRLFYPNPSLFYIPEYGRSDVWHFNYPVKDLLSKNLKENRLPLWSKDVGTGYPFFAEGQIGTFNISNLILFKLFPTWAAFNISYIVIFNTSFIGMWLLLRLNRFRTLPVLFSSFIFSFSGFFISHINHFALIQSASYFPLILYVGQKLFEKANYKYFVCLIFLLSQQLLTGNSQIFFYTFLTLFLMIVSMLKKNDQLIFIKRSLLLFFVLTMVILISAAQLIPTFELMKHSIRSMMYTNDLFSYPYKFQYLLTFINPYLFGKPQDASYPLSTPSESGIYWENVGYIGIAPILLVIMFLINTVNRRRKTYPHVISGRRNLGSLNFARGDYFIKLLIILALFSSLLLFANQSPFFFFLLFPGLSGFRNHTRILLILVFSLSCLSGYYLNTLFSRKNNYLYALLVVICGFSIYQIKFYYDQNTITVSKSLLLEKPKTADITNGSRVFTHYSHYDNYYKYFLNNGWAGIGSYVHFRSGLDENSNIIFGSVNVDVYSALPVLRQDLYMKNINDDAIRSLSAGYIISTKKINEDKGLYLIDSLDPPEENLPKYYIYKTDNYARFRIVTSYEVSPLNTDNVNLGFRQNGSNFGNSVILEEEIGRNFDDGVNYQIDLISDSDTNIKIRSTSDKDAILVMADSYFPGWEARINGKKTKIFPANINQRAIILPHGDNDVEFSFKPISLILGEVISLLGVLGLAIIFFKRDIFGKYFN